MPDFPRHCLGKSGEQSQSNEMLRLHSRWLGIAKAGPTAAIRRRAATAPHTRNLPPGSVGSGDCALWQVPR